jgi:thiamine phosphate synthase YjbQ (UPF0047 family)
MKGRMNVHSYFLVLLMVVVLFLLIYLFTYKDIETIFMPGAVCSICFILAGVQLRKELTAQKKKAVPEEEEHEHDEEESKSMGQGKSELRSYVIGFAWVIGLYISVLLIGFLISTPLFVFVYMKTHRRTWKASIITAACMGGLLYGLVIVLQMYLYPGILFGG